MSIRRFTLSAAALAAVSVAATGLTGPAAGASSVPPEPQNRPGARTMLRAGADDQVNLVTGLLGRNEVPVPGGPAVGDPDGRATAVIRLVGDQLSYTLTWENIGAPTAGHIHLGAVGANGPVVIELFSDKRSEYGSQSASGTVTVTDPAMLERLRSDPTAFYVNLHTAEFPGGAVRGRLHRLSVPVGADAVVAVRPVVRGAQIYRCTAQPDGTHVFTQHDVSAVLEDDIQHSFVRPVEGPPQWVAPDRSAVTGTVVARAANGTGNIAELDLVATQSGQGKGLLSRTGEILRLNTVGGVAPAGNCNPGIRLFAKVPYQADYVFVG